MIISRILFTCIFFLTFLNIILKKEDFLKPKYLFTLVISGCLMISSLKLSGLQNDFSVEFILIMLLAMINFVLGSLLNNKPVNNNIVFYNYDKFKFKIATTIIYFLVLLSYIITWKRLGPPPIFSKVDRSNYYLPRIEAIFLLIYLLTFLLIYDYFNKRALGKLFYFYIISVIFMVLSKTNKYSILYIFLMFFILYNILKIKIKIKTLVIIGIGIILMFLILYSFVYNDIYINTSQRYIVNKMNIPLELSFLIDPYIYIMCNFENLNNYIVNGPNTFFMGAASFKFIFSIMNIDSGVSETWKNNLQYPWLNTGSMFKDFYMDFGIIGIIIFTFLIGFIATYVYRKAISQKNILYCFLYTSITYALCMSFFTNYFAATDFVFNVIICYIVSKFIENSKA